MAGFTRREALKIIAAAGATACGPRDPFSVRGARAIQEVAPLVGAPWRTRDPFLFCVHHDDRYPAGNDRMGPATALDGRDLGQDFGGKDGWSMYHGQVVPGFPQHPHRGFETVTVVREGLLDHSDSLGAAARYGQGDVQWLTAGSGILHAEMFPLLQRDAPNPVELFQIWLNLPAARKMSAPHFSMLWDGLVPRHVARDAAGRHILVTVIAGRLGEAVPPAPPPASWAAQTGTDVAIWTLKLEPGARFTLPPASAGTDRSLYFFEGAALSVGGRAIPPRHEIRLVGNEAVSLEGGADVTEILMLQGRPIGEPVVAHGPFVMNTRDEIEEAFADFQRTRFGGWPWPGDDPVHGRDQGRFARHADGKSEGPA